MHTDKHIALQTIIAAENLTKHFNKLTAVEDVSFSINQGEVYGFLGQNGAGKSTTIRMLLGLIYPTSGKVHIKGQLFDNSKRHLLRHIGAVVERPDMYVYLSGWDNLRMFANLSDKRISNERLYEVLDIVGLKGRERDKVKSYSQGMKQRLGIAIALVHNPDLLILDEPTNGLDPQGIAEMRQLIIDLSRHHGKTILLSSHLLYEIEQIATHMLIIHKGRKLVDGNVNTLLHPDETLMEITLADGADLSPQLEGSAWQPHTVSSTAGIIQVKMNPEKMPDFNDWLVSHRARVQGIVSKHSLEAYFLSLTQ